MTTEQMSDAPPADDRVRDDAVEADGSPIDHVKEAVAKVVEAKEYASVLLAAKLDSLKLTARGIAIYAALGIVGALVAAGVLVTGVVLLLIGLAGLLGEMFPEKWERWGGPLVLGLIVVGGTAIGALIGMQILTRSSRKRTIEKYEHRKRTQRLEHGHDVAERAREQAGR